MEAQDRSEVLQIRQDTKYGQVYDKKDVFYFQGSTNLVTNIVFIICTSQLMTLINVFWFQLRNTITIVWPCTVPNLHLQIYKDVFIGIWDTIQPFTYPIQMHILDLLIVLAEISLSYLHGSYWYYGEIRQLFLNLFRKSISATRQTFLNNV